MWVDKLCQARVETWVTEEKAREVACHSEDLFRPKVDPINCFPNENSYLTKNSVEHNSCSAVLFRLKLCQVWVKLSQVWLTCCALQCDHVNCYAPGLHDVLIWLLVFDNDWWWRWTDGWCVDGSYEENEMKYTTAGQLAAGGSILSIFLDELVPAQGRLIN